MQWDQKTRLLRDKDRSDDLDDARGDYFDAHTPLLPKSCFSSESSAFLAAWHRFTAGLEVRLIQEQIYLGTPPPAEQKHGAPLRLPFKLSPLSSSGASSKVHVPALVLPQRGASATAVDFVHVARGCGPLRIVDPRLAVPPLLQCV